MTNNHEYRVCSITPLAGCTKACLCLRPVQLQLTPHPDWRWVCPMAISYLLSSFLQDPFSVGPSPIWGSRTSRKGCSPHILKVTLPWVLHTVIQINYNYPWPFSYGGVVQMFSYGGGTDSRGLHCIPSIWQNPLNNGDIHHQVSSSCCTVLQPPYPRLLNARAGHFFLQSMQVIFLDGR